MVILTVAASIMVMAVQGGLAAQEEALSLALAGTAAESRVAEYLARPYGEIAAANLTEAVGEMHTPAGDSFSASYSKMERHTVVTSASLTVPDFPGLAIPGYLIDVTVSDRWQGQPRELVSLQRFRPRTIEEEAAAP